MSAWWGKSLLSRSAHSPGLSFSPIFVESRRVLFSAHHFFLDVDTVRSGVDRELEDKSFEEINSLLHDRDLSRFGYQAVALLVTLLAYERIYAAYVKLFWE